MIYCILSAQKGNNCVLLLCFVRFKSIINIKYTHGIIPSITIKSTANHYKIPSSYWHLTEYYTSVIYFVPTDSLVYIILVHPTSIPLLLRYWVFHQ